MFDMVLSNRILCPCAGIVCLLLRLSTEPCQAQTGGEGKENGWETQWQVKAEIERIDNVFNLTSKQDSLLQSADSGVTMSGRFNDMESVDDLVFPASLDFEVSTEKGLRGRSFSLKAEIEYERYFRNPRKSNVQLGLSILQRTSDHGRVRIRSEYAPSTFAKNYLADAADSTGKVDPSERVYEAGIYSEWEVAIDYKHHFREWMENLTGIVVLGYGSRKYDEPFAGRDLGVVHGEASLDYSFATWWTAQVGYVYEFEHNPVHEEVLVLDEPDFWLDFNDDRDTADKNRRTVQLVDRSNKEQSFEISTDLRIVKDVSVHAGFEHLKRDYTSQQVLDPAHRDREDKRNTLRLGIDYSITKGLHIIAGYEHTEQKSNRDTDPESLGETADYKTNVFSSGIKWQF